MTLKLVDRMKFSRDSSLKRVPYSAISRVHSMMDVNAKYRDLAGVLRKRNGDLMFLSEDVR